MLGVELKDAARTRFVLRHVDASKCICTLQPGPAGGAYLATQTLIWLWGGESGRGMATVGEGKRTEGEGKGRRGNVN